MTRRRFAFWLGFGLFSLAERLRVYGLDELAAATMRAAQPATPSETSLAVHWRAADNEAWRWYERETFLSGRWTLSGITTPINKISGQPYEGKTGYLDDSVVPDHVREGAHSASRDNAGTAHVEYGPGDPHPNRRSRHGRPPSKWLRSLEADELQIWLKTIDPPEAGVSGMTYWTHLTRDHSFNPIRIAGLSIEEQAKLHAAAHYGY